MVDLPLTVIAFFIFFSINLSFMLEMKSIVIISNSQSYSLEYTLLHDMTSTLVESCNKKPL